MRKYSWDVEDSIMAIFGLLYELDVHDVNGVSTPMMDNFVDKYRHLWDGEWYLGEDEGE